VLSMNRANGKIRWIAELRRWRDQAGKKGPIFYSGPVLAGGRLIVAGTNGALINIDPATGVVQSQTGAGDSVTAQPVVAGSTLYILTEGGRLVAYR
jgi:outer membrane protein assembly factor BamB